MSEREKKIAPWLTVDERALEVTDRLMVPGGWLYRTRMWGYEETGVPSVAMVFVPDTSVYPHETRREEYENFAAEVRRMMQE